MFSSRVGGTTARYALPNEEAFHGGEDHRAAASGPTGHPLPDELDGGGAGTDGTFSVQLILDEGAATHVIRPTADDLDVLYSLMKKESAVYFDMERNVLMFQTQSIG